MADQDILTPADVADIRSARRDPARVGFQLNVLRAQKRSVPILRAATTDDGIRRFKNYDLDVLCHLHEEARAAGRISAFVPASGSGTRLFHSLLHLYRTRETDLDRVRGRAASGDDIARDALEVLEHITQFALWVDLDRRGCSPTSVGQILHMLFADGGLRYHERPKGLIPFHLYGDEVETAFAAHLREAAVLVTDRRKNCDIHFTIAADHQTHFQNELRREAPRLEQALGVRFCVDFSVQSPETDTIATDLDGHLRRDRAGHLAFNPGGHGALLHNLSTLGGDIVLIKTIDNIARRELLPTIAAVRRQISGLLVHIEKQVHGMIRRLREGDDLEDALQFLDHQFGVAPAAPLPDEGSRRLYAMAQLNRPLRVCGVVSALDHAGGRPFWTDTSRGPCLQIIEGAEINLDDAGERARFHESRHFNPVDIACSLRDVDGKLFDFAAFAIPDRVIIARKVLRGVSTLVYEHPGLWNGGMGLWNTIFVEMPDLAFNPVKSLAALRGSGHGPWSGSP